MRLLLRNEANFAIVIVSANGSAHNLNGSLLQTITVCAPKKI